MGTDREDREGEQARKEARCEKEGRWARHQASAACTNTATSRRRSSPCVRCEGAMVKVASGPHPAIWRATPHWQHAAALSSAKRMWHPLTATCSHRVNTI